MDSSIDRHVSTCVYVYYWLMYVTGHQPPPTPYKQHSCMNERMNEWTQVAADGVLLEYYDVTANESSLTGPFIDYVYIYIYVCSACVCEFIK